MDWISITELGLTSAAIGAFLPILIGWVNWYIKNTVIKECIALGLSFIVGYFIVRETGEMNTGNLFMSVGLVASAAQVTYIKYFNPKWSAENK